MTQNRKPPAYLEYAATILANRPFKLMTLAERGLFYTLRLECWENKQAPVSSRDLAKYTGCDIAEIEKALTDNVKAFFVEKDGLFSCPELEDYRQHLEDRKSQQSKGGKRGATATNSKINKPRKPDNANDLGMPSGNLQVPRRGSVESLVQHSTSKQSQTQSLESSDTTDEWADAYERASNG